MKINFIMAGAGMAGGDRVCAIYAKKLIDKGHQVTVIAPPTKLLTFQQQLKRIVSGSGWISKSSQLQNHFDQLGVKVTYLETKRKITENDVPDADVIIATWWLTSEWIKDFRRSKGVKVHFVQGHEIFNHLPIEQVKRVYELPFYKIAIATWLVDVLKINYKATRVALVPNSVDLQIFNSEVKGKQTIPTVGFLFSEVECKGGAIAIKVIEQLKSIIPTLRVISFGMRKPEKLKLPSYVELQINPAQDQIRSIYKQCDVWLCCSLNEGFGLTILEAMACRTPAVSTECGGPEDIITHGSNGFLCNVNDIDGLVESVNKLLMLTEEEWLIYSDNAYQRAASYTWDDALNLFECALENALNDEYSSQDENKQQEASNDLTI